MSEILRRIGKVVMISALLAGVLAACGSTATTTTTTPSGTSAGGTISIGIIAPLSGADAAIGAPDLQGADIAAQLANSSGGVLGKKIKIVSADDQATGAGAVTAIRTLVGSNVNLIVGGNTTPECQALIPLLSSLKVVLAMAGCATDNLTGPGVNPWLFRTYTAGGPQIDALMHFICKTFPGINRVDSMMPNYDYGLFQLSTVNSALKSDCGAKAGTTVLVPITATSAGSAVDTVLARRSSTARQDSVLDISMFGPALANAVKVGAPEGLFSGYRAVFTTSGPAFTTLLPTFGSNVPATYVGGDYTYLNTGGNSAAFESAFMAKYHTEASGEAGEVFNSFNAILAAIRKAGSTDASKVRTALEGLSFTATQPNPVTINAQTHQGNPELNFLFFRGTSVKLVGSAPYPTS